MILSRYINKQIITSILMVLLVLVGIQSFIQLAAQLQDVGKGDYSWAQAFLFVPLMLPSDVYQLFPMAALIGSLIGLGRLATHSELIVMCASGLSKAQIIRAVLMGAFLLLVLMTLLGEVLGPLARDKALNMKDEALNAGQTLTTKNGTWIRDGHDFIHIRNKLSKNKISGITHYQFDNQHRLIIASYAKEGRYTKGQWTFYDVEKSMISPDQVKKEHVDHMTSTFKIKPKQIGLHEADPNQLSFKQLKKHIHFRKHSGAGVGVFEFVFWKRIFQPFGALVMILLAVPFIFGPLRSVPMGVRIVAGVVAGFVFYILNQFFGPLSLVYQLPPLLAAAMPITLFAMIGGYLLIWKI